jgi:hypothetical protein
MAGENNDIPFHDNFFMNVKNALKDGKDKSISKQYYTYNMFVDRCAALSLLEAYNGLVIETTYLLRVRRIL